MFQDKTRAPGKIVAPIFSIFTHFPQTKKGSRQKSFSIEQIDLSKPWDYFNGASQNQLCGGGFTLHLSNTHYFHSKLGLGLGTNNHGELLTLKFLLSFKK